MGKSIQGAGGALVLGTVFKSIVMSTHQSEINRERFPESWLSSCFRGLQNVFIAFDGLMMVSVVIGLVDVENGVLYYINADHPRVVLYREGQASYMHDFDTLSRLGLEQDDGAIQVYTQQMQAGDVIVCGTDGRDDLVLGRDEDGNQIINMDEELFLTMVQESGAELDPLLSAIKAKGSLSDDLSMLKITYNNPDKVIDYDPIQLDQKLSEAQQATRDAEFERAETLLQEAQTLAPEASPVWLALAQFYEGREIYERAVAAYRWYLEMEPLDKEVILKIASIYRKMNEWRDAAIFGDRYQLRNPDHPAALQLLVEVYSRSHRYDLALARLQRLRNLSEPGIDLNVLQSELLAEQRAHEAG